MLRASLIAVTTVLSLSGCAPADIEAHLDGSLSRAEGDEVIRAVNDWNARAVSQIRLGDSRSDWLILKADTPDDSLGFAQRRRQIVRIDPSTPPDQVYAVALHELGHALGLNHTAGGVMDPQRQLTAFSDADMDECRRVGACD
jgi:predicted Zn-dependent protease